MLAIFTSLIQAASKVGLWSPETVWLIQTFVELLSGPKNTLLVHAYLASISHSLVKQCIHFATSSECV